MPRRSRWRSLNTCLHRPWSARTRRAVDVLWEKMYSTMRLRGHSTGFMTEAISGVDIALWDIFGKSVGLPIYQLLGGPHRDRIVAYASGVPGRTIEEQVANARRFVEERGFTAVKMSTGRKSLEEEMAAVAAISEALSDDAHLLVDAHGAYDAYTAIQLGREMQALGVYWLEDPLPPEDHSGYKMLSDALDMAIAAGETECNRYQFRDRLAARAVDILLPDVCRAGGISECLKIARLADAYNVPWAAHVSMGSPIHIAASLHLAAATPNFLDLRVPDLSEPDRRQPAQEAARLQRWLFRAAGGAGTGHRARSRGHRPSEGSKRIEATMSLEMTSRERLWAVLNQQEPDRVPIWMLYPREQYGSYVDVHNLPSYARVMPHIWERTDWLDRRDIGRGAFYSAAADIETSIEEREGWTITRSILHTPLGDLTAEHRQDQENAAGARTEHYCKEIGDLEKVLSIPYEPVEPDLTAFDEAATRLGDAGLMMVNLGMPIGVAYGLAHPETFSHLDAHRARDAGRVYPGDVRARDGLSGKGPAERGRAGVLYRGHRVCRPAHVLARRL